jgi:iron complex outermembrane receptor protein
MEGDSYGIEAWANWQVLSWWRLSPGVFWEHQNLRFKAGAPAGVTDSASGDDPAQQVHLRSSMDLGNQVTLDFDLREVGALPSPHVPGYVELNGRLGWQATKQLELSLDAENLLHNEHLEFLSSSFPIPVEIGRTVFVEARWRF